MTKTVPYNALYKPLKLSTGMFVEHGMTKYSMGIMEKTLQKLDLSPKESKIYLTLLGSGPMSLRMVAEETDINRGSAYDALKALMKKGLVSFYDKDKKQHFVAEDPENLVSMLRDKRREVVRTKKELAKILPDLQARFEKGDEKPSVKLYESREGAKAILEDVLRVMSKKKNREYYVYSSFTRDMREHLYRDFESFSERRIALGVNVKTIGPKTGGETRGLDERRYLPKLEKAPSYIIIYGSKVAILSFSKENYLMSVLINDAALAETQRILFKALWDTLPKGKS